MNCKVLFIITLAFLLLSGIGCSGKKEAKPGKNDSTVTETGKVESPQERFLVSVNEDYTSLRLYPSDKEIGRFGVMKKGNLEAHTRFYANGNLIGLFPDEKNETDDWLLFFADKEAGYKVLERGVERYYTFLGKPRNCENVYILYMAPSSNWLACVDNEGQMGLKIFFTPSFVADIVNVKYDKNGLPVTIVLDSIDMYAEYSVNLQTQEILQTFSKNYDHTGYKP